MKTGHVVVVSPHSPPSDHFFGHTAVTCAVTSNMFCAMGTDGSKTPSPTTSGHTPSLLTESILAPP
jgi:hypothetical protein